MKPELNIEYLHSIKNESLPRFISMSEEAWVSEWRKQVANATDYDSFPSSWSIPSHVWEERLKAAWARLVEYDRLTAKRQAEALSQESTR